MNPRLTVRIGVFYTLLAVINIIFFSIMIFENQTDLLQNNFRYHSESIVRTVLGDLQELTIRRAADENLEELKRSLAHVDIRSFLIFDRAGELWHSPGAENADQDPGATAVDSALRARADELANQELVFRARYTLVLNEDDFSVDLLLPLRGLGERGPEKIFLSAVLSVRDMQERLNALYYQVAVAVLWGVVFHVLFAIFVYRLIFRRLNVLKEASLRMAGGDLEARAQFPRQGGDELDDLGDSFNTMAAGIQDKVETISDQITTIQ
ncbi:MAG: HAMP domain-containing protein, partial [Leptospirales bacterium]